MATYKELQDRICLDYLNRYDLIPQTKRAINNAIKCYEAQRFWFNEASTATVATVTVAQVGVPSDFLELDRLEIFYGSNWQQLYSDTHDTIRRMNATSLTGVPTHFTYRGDAFELALIPDSAYPINTYYLKSLPALSADTDTNAWTNEAANLITHAAVLDVVACGIVPVQPAVVNYHQQALLMARKELQSRNSLRLSGKLKPTQF